MSGLPDYETAIERALRAVPGTLGVETVPLAEADRRVLRKPIVADRDLPPFDRAAMDGYALRFDDLEKDEPLPVDGRVAAGERPPEHVPEGACVRIATGAAVPEVLDTVVEHERTNREDPVTIACEGIERGRAIHPRGADARAGSELVPAGVRLEPVHLAIAATTGLRELQTSRRPRIVLLTSGDEIVAPGEDVEAHQVRNSSVVGLPALLRRLGGDVVRAEHVPDEPGPTNEAVREAVRSVDILVTVGGVSAGERDRFPDAFEAANVEEHVRGAAIQPGKPILVGGNGSCVVVALPGNPVSSLACCLLFAGPIIDALAGCTHPRPSLRLPLAAPVRPNPRRQAFRPAICEDGGVRVPAWSGSGDLAHVAPTHGLAVLPVQEAEVAAGTVVEFKPWP